ncbi:MAG TPA: BRO family protein [Clostridia bacterium]|nr:BRO family protein [Clostridia bacterium]
MNAIFIRKIENHYGFPSLPIQYGVRTDFFRSINIRRYRRCSIQIFNNSEFGQIRTLEKNDNTLFCGKDIAAALGYENATKAVPDHCRMDGGLKRYPIIDDLGRTQEAIFISEGDVINHTGKYVRSETRRCHTHSCYSGRFIFTVLSSMESPRFTSCFKMNSSMYFCKSQM